MLYDRYLLFRLLLAATGPIQCTAFKSDPSTGSRDPLPAAEDAGAKSSLGEEPGRSTGEAGGSCDVNRPFGPAAPALQQLGSLFWTSTFRLSSDYLTGYFAGARRGDTSASNLYVTTRSAIDGSFGNASVLPVIGLAPPDQVAPTVTGDGLTLAFCSFPPGALARLHYATRANLSATFKYAGLIPRVNDPSGGDQTPFFREDGQVLYFASSRVAANGNDIYRSQRDGSEFQPPVVVDELNTRYNEVGPAATPDDLTIYFASARPGAMGDMDIYVATRQSKSGRFSHVRPVTELNTPAVEIPSFVTRDNCTLYFYSDRDRALTIYVATRPAG